MYKFKKGDLAIRTKANVKHLTKGLSYKVLGISFDNGCQQKIVIKCDDHRTRCYDTKSFKLTTISLDRTTMHPYYCPLCGNQLNEISLGFLGCETCQSQFMPTSTQDGRYRKLTWKA